MLSIYCRNYTNLFTKRAFIEPMKIGGTDKLIADILVASYFFRMIGKLVSFDILSGETAYDFFIFKIMSFS